METEHSATALVTIHEEAPKTINNGIPTPAIDISIVPKHESQDREMDRKPAKETNNEMQISTSQMESEEVNRDQNEGPPKVYMTGWRLHLLTFALCLSLLLSTLETTIVSTSLTSISNSLRNFEQSGWIVTSYLLTYTGFLIIYAKFSDIFGRKLLILLAIATFTAFSIICGVSQTMLQLIIFRSFQGIGGSGIYSIVTVIAPDMVPMENAPAGVVTISLLTFGLPSNFPYGSLPRRRKFRQIFSRDALKRLDLLGAFLSLAASILSVFALEQGGTKYGWSSAVIVCSLVLSGVLWVAFLAWERILEKGVQEPIFPWRLLRHRILAGMLLNGFFTGFPFMAAIINLPQRFQAVNRTSPSGAGFRLLPILLCSPFASALSGLVVTKFRVPPFLPLLIACSLQVVGVGLIGTLSTSESIQAAQYGYEIILGVGFGLGLGTLLIMAPLVAEKRDLAVTMGALTQIRVLGGTVSLAICSTILNNHLKSDIGPILTRAQIQDVFESTSAILDLDQGIQQEVRCVFGAGYNKEMKTMLYFTIAGFLTILLIWEKQPR
ncbi:MAG: hypothetical protein M1834_007877 [Cirrosporium novae-zelandiae]|nr:MAG: hypothetical protein M1834_007877 [Cirrosporium novae-zelandiae]